MAKSDRIKLPKRVAGVKIPKTIRKGPVADFINSSAGKLLIAEALIAVIGLFAAKHVDGAAASDTLKNPGDAVKRIGRNMAARGEDAQVALTRSTARLQFALGEAVRAFREALAEPGMVGSPNAEVATGLENAKRGSEPEGEGGKKKQNRSSSDPTPH